MKQALSSVALQEIIPAILPSLCFQSVLCHSSFHSSQMIEERLRNLQLAGGQVPLSYWKAYPATHDDVPLEPNYSRPKFRLFDGTGNPVQHLAHSPRLILLYKI